MKYWNSVPGVQSLIPRELSAGGFKEYDVNKVAHTLTTKFSESTGHLVANRDQVPILITSMGGSGTTFLANTFKKAGIKVLHEAVGEHGTIGWWQLFNLNQLRVWERLIMFNRTISMRSSLNKLKKLCKSGGIWVKTNGGSYKKPVNKKRVETEEGILKKLSTEKYCL